MKTIKYILYRLKWNLAPYFNFKNPVHLDLELNNSCNQKCSMCWHSESTPFVIQSMKFPAAMNIIRSAAINKIKSIKFNLRGEPLMYKHINIIFSESRKLGFVDRMINTNGVLLNKGHFESGLNNCTVSLDALDYENYKKIHNDSFQNFIKIIGNLKSARFYKHFSVEKIKVKLNVHINKHNIFDPILKHTEFSGFPVVKKYTKDRKGSNISIDKKERTRKTMCPHLKRRLTVHVNGDVYPCCLSYDSPNDIKLGNIYDSTIKELWNGAKRKELIDNYKNGLYYDTCKNCTSNDIYKD